MTPTLDSDSLFSDALAFVPEYGNSNRTANRLLHANVP
jgi:hypothetical protein